MKILKILGITLGVLVILLIVASIVARIVFTKEKILALVIPQVEKALKREVTVQDASVSIFPGIRLNLDSLVIKNKPGYQEPHLISLQKFSVQLKFWPLLKKRIELKKLILVKPDVYLESKGEKESNYQEFLQIDKEKKIVPITFDLLEIKNGRIVYYDRPAQSTLVLQDLNQEASLKLVDDRFLTSQGKLKLGNLQLKSASELLSYPLELSYQASYDLIFDSLKLEQSQIKFGELVVNAHGKIEDLTRKPRLSLELQADDMAIAKVTSLLPKSQRELSQKWKTSGSLSFKISAKWDFVNGAMPTSMDGDISGKKLELSPGPDLPTVHVPLLSGQLSSNSISFSTSQASIGEAPLDIRLVLDNLADPRLTGEVNTSFDVSLLSGFFKASEGTKLSGKLELSTSFFGKLKDLRNSNLAGRCDLDQVSIASPGLALPIEGLSARMKLAGGELLVEKFSARQGDSRFSFSGSCKELVPYLLSKKDDKSSKPTFNFQLSSSYLNLDQLLPASDSLQPAQDSAAANAFYLGLAQFINLQGKLAIDTAVFRQVQLTEFKADLSLADGVIKLSNVSGQVYSGTVKGEALCDLSNPDEVKFNIKVQSQGMEANQFLSRFSRLSDQLYGKLDFQGEFNGAGNSVPQIQKSLSGDGQVAFTEGKLANSDFMQKLSGFLKVKEFDEEAIQNLQHGFLIKDSRLYFSDFFAKSKRADWKAAGSMGLLDQTLDYSLAILLSAELSGQVNILGEEGKFLQDPEGRLLIPLKISGTSGAPVFTLDLSLISEKLKDQLKQNLQNKSTDAKDDLKKKGKEILEGLFKKKGSGS